MYHPAPGRQIDAAGIHRLRFAVRAFDRRAIGDPRNVGRRAGPPLRSPPVLSTRDVDEVVRDALIQELRHHDLRVTAPDRCDVLIEVELTDFYALVEGGGSRGPLQGGEVEGHITGEVRVFAGRSGDLRLDLPFRGFGSVDTLLLTARKYEWALNAALADFAQRVVRHPDVLIAAQSTLVD